MVMEQVPKFDILIITAKKRTLGWVCMSKCQKRKKIEMRNEKWQENIINFCGCILALKFEHSSKTIMT